MELSGNIYEIEDSQKKKYVAVEDPKLYKIDNVNFFLQCVLFPKKN